MILKNVDGRLPPRHVETSATAARTCSTFSGTRRRIAAAEIGVRAGAGLFITGIGSVVIDGAQRKIPAVFVGRRKMSGSRKDLRGQGHVKIPLVGVSGQAEGANCVEKAQETDLYRAIQPGISFAPKSPKVGFDNARHGSGVHVPARVRAGRSAKPRSRNGGPEPRPG